MQVVGDCVRYIMCRMSSVKILEANYRISPQFFVTDEVRKKLEMLFHQSFSTALKQQFWNVRNTIKIPWLHHGEQHSYLQGRDTPLTADSV